MISSFWKKLNLSFSFSDPPSNSDITIHHPLPVYFRVKPTLRTPSGKRCRKSRTVFTDLQLRVLEKTFSEQRYLDSTNRAKLSHILGLNEAQVKTWFQNRRMKWKKKAVAKADKPDSSSTGKKAEKTDRVEVKNDKETGTKGRDKLDHEWTHEQYNWIKVKEKLKRRERSSFISFD